MSEHLEMSNIEKFELLSAYLDGEVDASERQQVETLLRTDAAFQAQYRRMQGMQQAFQHIPVTDVSLPVADLADCVFAKIEARRQSRWLKIGGGAVAAALVAAGASVTGLWGGVSRFEPQFAQGSLPTEAPVKLEIVPNPAPMMVALNDSIVQIPQKNHHSAQHEEENDLGLIDALDLDADDI